MSMRLECSPTRLRSGERVPNQSEVSQSAVRADSPLPVMPSIMLPPLDVPDPTPLQYDTTCTTPSSLIPGIHRDMRATLVRGESVLMLSFQVPSQQTINRLLLAGGRTRAGFSADAGKAEVMMACRIGLGLVISTKLKYNVRTLSHLKDSVPLVHFGSR
jgi:hypothetical protein